MSLDGPLYPVNLDVAGRRVLVVGGGAVALGKVQGLLEAGARVDVVAPRIDDAVRALGVGCDQRPYRRGEVAGYRLAFACTDEPAVNRAVFEDAEAAGVWVNSADDPANCAFTLPARIRRGDLVVTVSTTGRSPALAAWLRDRLADELGPEYATLLELLAEHRDAVQAEGRRTDSVDWRSVLDSGIVDLVRAGRLDQVRERLRAASASNVAPSPGKEPGQPTVPEEIG